MVDYGMSRIAALQSATSVAARVLHLEGRRLVALHQGLPPISSLPMAIRQRTSRHSAACGS